MVANEQPDRADDDPLTPAREPGGRLSFPSQEDTNSMSNHLTPDEIAKEHGLQKRDVLRLCLEEHVPVLNGRIDRSLFEAVLQGSDLRAASGPVS
jgi:hypothetical protein